MVPQEPYWVDGFTKGVNPVACHSHNDYDRDVPLYDAIAAGCTGVEADLSAVGDELFVDHSRLSSKDGDHRTIQRLYLDPIMAILKGQNSELVKRSTSWNESQAAPSWRGVFDEKPEQTLSLLCDFKSSTGTYPVLVKALQPLRDAGWLTGYNTRTKEMRWGPVTIVASGDAPFDQINVANPTGIPGYDIRDIFYDAPLRDLGDGSVYNATNSYYASSSLIMAVGPVLPTGMTQGQKDKVGAQLKAAKDLNLLGRYWGTPSWPVSNKIRSWRVFNERGAGMLNVDNLKLATQWNWDICNIMGYELC